MSPRPLVPALLVLFASARAEAACPAVYTNAAWEADMRVVDDALDAGNTEGAATAFRAVDERLVCLGEIASPDSLGWYARQKALLAFLDQDGDTAMRWAQLARAVAPDLPWPNQMPASHPFRKDLAAAPTPPMGGRDDASFVVERGGAVFVDGKFTPQPRALAEMNHLVQVFDKRGLLVSTTWQDGGVFPDTMLGPKGADLELPAWVGAGPVKPPKNDKPPKADKPPKPKPEGGPSVGALVAGGALAVAAGALYGVGAVVGGGLGDATTGDEMVKIRTTTNALVLGSGVLGAAAVGVGVVAFVTDDGVAPGVGFRVRW